LARGKAEEMAGASVEGNGARAGPFIGARERERERDGGDDEHRRARHDGGNDANAD
jgi:hypothetical protein